MLGAPELGPPELGDPNPGDPNPGESPPGAAGPGEPAPAGSPSAGPAPVRSPGRRLPIGPGEAGGRKGTSSVWVVPSESSLDPAVIAAKVGTEASPTRSATISTYRRVGPENPLSAR